MKFNTTTENIDLDIDSDEFKKVINDVEGQVKPIVKPMPIEPSTSNLLDSDKGVWS